MRNILLIEDELLIANDLGHILQSVGFHICGILDGTENISEIINDTNPDIIICDIYLKDNKNGIEIMKPIQSVNTKPLIFITAYSTKEVIDGLSEITHDGYILKPYTSDQVIATTKLTALKYKLSNEHLEITKREKEIVNLIINGLNTNEIAERLNISHHTVETHRKNIYKKLEVTSVSQLIQKATSIQL